jgi:futalosine hydrolase
LSDLILIPTEFERRPIEEALPSGGRNWSIETVGFGVVSAGIRTANALTRHQPSRVLLAGIAGLFGHQQRESVSVGDATWFDSVAIDGIGIGQGDQYVDAIELGWDWYGLGGSAEKLRCEKPIASPEAMLLTVCAGSANKGDAERRATRYPHAVGEDMESFAVALACAAAGVRMSVVRGFSNIVGQRDQSLWRVEAALSAVADQLRHVIQGRKA